MAYYKQHYFKVKREDQKQQYRLALDLTLDRGFDLKLIHKDNDAQFYIDQGVLKGVAKRFIRNVTSFLNQYNGPKDQQCIEHVCYINRTLTSLSF